ncbi:MAG: hypothetical protein ACQES9_09995, partial [Myxococcota bacterium]
MKRFYFICTAILVSTGMAVRVSAQEKAAATKTSGVSDKTEQVEDIAKEKKSKKVEKDTKKPKTGKFKKIRKKINKIGQKNKNGKIIRLDLKKAIKLAREKNVNLRIKALEIAEARIKKIISKIKLYPV